MAPPSLPKPSRLLSRLGLLLPICLPSVLGDINHEIDTQNWLLEPVANVDGIFATPWQCGGSGPGVQSILQLHENWHCTNPGILNDRFGARFFGFHKQFLQGYNAFLAKSGEPNVQVWYPEPNKAIPPDHGGRGPNRPCTSCTALGSEHKLPDLGDFKTLDELGRDINRWHGDQHIALSGAGGTGSCPGPDIGCTAYSPADPIFYRYHHIFDEIQDQWRKLQPTDIAIVLDRSGSMDLPSKGAATRLDAAKEAVQLFAGLLDNGVGDPTLHRAGLVSFSTTASSPVDVPLTGAAAAPAALTAPLSALVAGGSTSIGAGLRSAQNLLTAGGNDRRKAILLLTDGIENTSPRINDVKPELGDTHICSIGLGTPGSLDGPKLQDLSERHGGIYISTPNALQMKKYFVVCFANIFDTDMAVDPLETLPAGSLISAPTVHQADGDEKIVFVLGWDGSSSAAANASAAAGLRLAITTPSGSVLDLAAPGVQSRVGSSWQVVRVKTPYYGEGDGEWVARAVRPARSFVNGFTSRTFEDPERGADLIRAELSALCAERNRCRNILYWEDRPPWVSGPFREMNSIYATALAGMRGRGIIGNITAPTNASDFARVLRQPAEFDLIVYSSQYTAGEQPYDLDLLRLLCSSGHRIPSIVSDNRLTDRASAILGCVGAVRGAGTNFTSVLPTNSSLLSGPAALRSPPSVANSASFEIRAANGTSGSVEATFGNNAAAVLSFGDGGAGGDLDYFITVLARGPGKVQPAKYRNNTYTLEDLHPTFHIPATHWPDCGYSRINATVAITRPLRSLSQLLASAGSCLNSTGPYKGDAPTSSTAAAQALGAAALEIPTETVTFPLYDDGTHGDTTAGDHYWEAALPADWARFDGDYHLHARFQLCQTSACGKKETCITREAQQTITVLAQLTPGGCKYTVQQLAGGGGCCGGRRRACVRITPADGGGTLLGPGWAERLLVAGGGGDVKVEDVVDAGQGVYEIVVNYGGGGNYSTPAGKPVVTVGQFGRPRNVVRIEL